MCFGADYFQWFHVAGTFWLTIDMLLFISFGVDLADEEFAAWALISQYAGGQELSWTRGFVVIGIPERG